jgi:predicted nucleic acid-binding protein
MITAVDTSILIDVFGDDPEFGASSADCLRDCLQAGTVVACDIVWAETRGVFPDDASFQNAMSNLGIHFSALLPTSAALAGSNWKAYRKAGGKKSRVVADFMIGAHATLQADRLLTRDRGYYRAHFADLKLVDGNRPKDDGVKKDS